MKRLWIILICLGVLFSGCALDKANKRAEQFIGSYLDKYNESDYQGMYSMFSDEEKARASYDKFYLEQKKLSDKLGKITSYKPVNWESSSIKGPTRYVFSYKVEFERNKGPIAIIFSLLHKDDKFAFVAGGEIRFADPNDMP